MQLESHHKHLIHFTTQNSIKLLQQLPAEADRLTFLDHLRNESTSYKARQICLIVKVNNRSCWGVNGVWSLLCWLQRLMRWLFVWRRRDNGALYGRGSAARPRGHHNDTPQISLSGLLIGHGHLPLHPHTDSQSHSQTEKRVHFHLNTGALCKRR